MLIASIFVDISRARLARAVAESSADLALSTLMTNYDYDLSQYYGLMGSCQNIGEHYSLAAEYYDTALHSRDVDDEELQLLYQRVMNNFGSGGETISDILGIQNRTEGAVVTSLDGANMYNATILQEQVVEFMKYRGPIVIAQEIIGKLQGEGDGVAALEDGGQNKEIVDDKTEFYEAEGELLKAAFDVYWLTRDYTDRVGDNGENMSAQKLQQYARSLEDYRAVYGEIHRHLVGSLFNTGNLSGAYSRVTIALDSYADQYDKTSAEIYSRMETPTPAATATPAPAATAAPTSPPSSEPVYYVDGDRVTALTEELKNARDDFVTARDAFASACGSLMGTLPGPGEEDAHAVQWWVQMDAAVNSHTGTNYTEELSSRADALVRAYAKVQAMTECEGGDNVPVNWKDDSAALLNEVQALHGRYLTDGVADAADGYLNAVNRLEQISAANADKLRPSALYVTVDGQSRSVENAVPYLRKRLDDMQKETRAYAELLDKLLDASEDGTSPLDQLCGLAGNYDARLDEWSRSVQNALTATSGDMAREHLQEMEDLRHLKNEEEDKFQSHQASDSMEITIDEAAVARLKERLANIRSQYRILDSAIEGMQYGGSLLRELADVDAMKGCAGAAVQNGAIGLTNREVREYADSTFSQLFAPNTGTIAALHDVGDNAYNPLMSPATGNIDTPDLYVYMHSKFKDTSRDAVEKEEKEQENAKEQAETKKKEKDKDRYHGGGEDITSDSKEDGFSFAASALTGLVRIVGDLFRGEVDNIRDNLYATVYIMEMFSYATFENEGRYSLLEEDVKKQLTLSEGDSSYYKEEYKDTDAAWLSADEEDAYNKTLTNRLISKENNVAYLAEVEYILYGKSNVESVRAAYQDIFAVRYILNLVSAFANFWSPGKNPTATAVNSVAGAVMAVTAGVIPAALTKVVLLPILAVFETCRDLDRLEAGFPVELYKQADDWWYGFQQGNEPKTVGDFMGGLTGNGTNRDKGLQYSDYLTLFVYLGLQREDDASGKMYLRMADVIQANMVRATGDSKYALANTQVYFRLKAKLRVDPLMLTLPYYTDYVDDPTMKDDWCTFEVETIRGY